MRAEARREMRPVAAIAPRDVTSATVVQEASGPLDHARCRRIAKDCALLALVGLAAVAIAIALPSDDRAQSPNARGNPWALQPAAAPGADALRPAVPEHAGSAEMQSDYFPAQFPAPRGEVEEQPASF